MAAPLSRQCCAHTQNTLAAPGGATGDGEPLLDPKEWALPAISGMTVTCPSAGTRRSTPVCSLRRALPHRYGPHHARSLVGHADEFVCAGSIECVPEAHRLAPRDVDVDPQIGNGEGVELRLADEREAHRLAGAKAEIDGVKCKWASSAGVVELDRDLGC